MIQFSKEILILILVLIGTPMFLLKDKEIESILNLILENRPVMAVILAAVILYTVYKTFSKKNILDFSSISRIHFGIKSKLFPLKESTDSINKGNCATAILYINDEMHEYFAVSGYKNQGVNWDYAKENKINVCNKGAEFVSKILPTRRLLPDLTWGRYKNGGFADGYLTCSERKILAEIIDKYTLEALRGLRIVIYTELEPCIYCYSTMQELMVKYGIRIEVFFDEMVDEIMEDYDVSEDILKALRDIKSMMTVRRRKRNDVN